MEKLIITVAPTGSLVVPTQTPYLPITPEQIANEVLAAAEAGAVIAHIHARDPEDGRPSSDLKLMQDILTRIKKQSDIILCLTTGGAPGFTVEQRYAPVSEFKPELASFDMGSLGISVHPIAERIKDEDWRYPWEKEHLMGLKDYVFTNTWADFEEASKIFKESNTMPELGIYDVGHLYNLRFLLKREFVKPPLQMNFVLGVLGTIGGSVEDIAHLKNTADRLFGADTYHWGVIGAGYPLAFHAGAISILMGGGVRVGMEDNVFIERRVLAKNNAELVEKVVRIAKELGREIATPDEARKMLKLKGKDKVNF
jgi:uncharacterized protein (DUF849 family)